MARTGELWQTRGRDDPHFAVFSTDAYQRSRGRAPPSRASFSHRPSRVLLDLHRLGVGELSLEFLPQPAGFESVTMYLRRTVRSA